MLKDRGLIQREMWEVRGQALLLWEEIVRTQSLAVDTHNIAFARISRKCNIPPWNVNRQKKFENYSRALLHYPEIVKNHTQELRTAKKNLEGNEPRPSLALLEPVNVKAETGQSEVEPGNIIRVAYEVPSCLVNKAWMALRPSSYAYMRARKTDTGIIEKYDVQENSGETKFTAPVKKGSYAVILYAHAKRGSLVYRKNVKVTPKAITYLSEIKEVSKGNLHHGLGKDGAAWSAGQGFKIRGQEFSHGIVTHPPQTEKGGKRVIGFVEYELAGNYTIFSAVVGRFGESGAKGCDDSQAMNYRVIVDGNERAAGDFNNIQRLSINVRGAYRLRLEVDDGGDEYWCDHAAWGDAKLLR